MTKVTIRKKILRVLDPGRKDRGVLSVNRSGEVKVNTDRILNSPRGRSQVRTMEEMAAENEKLDTA